MTDMRERETTPPQPSEATGHETARQNNWFGLVAVLSLLAVLWVRAGWEFVVIVAAIIVIIFFHELGHYVAAKRGGMKVTEFFLGFGPRVWSFRRGETEYGLKAIPAGAYVKIPGMNNLEEVDPADEARTYRQASFPKRLAVAVAGSAMHFLMALLMIYALLVGWGIERDAEAWTVSEVAADGAAIGLGFEPGDRITAIDDVAVATFDDVRSFVALHPGETVAFTVVRGDEQLTLTGAIGLQTDDASVGRLGVSSRPGDLPFIERGPIEAVPETFQIFGEVSQQSITALVNFFTPGGLSDFFGLSDDGSSTGAGVGGQSEDGERLVSIVGATQIGADAVAAGLAVVLTFLFLLNIFIGIFNLVPLLPLDGGHVAIAVYERLRELGTPRNQRYHADVAKMLPVAYAVFFVLVAVGMMAIYRDITDPLQL